MKNALLVSIRGEIFKDYKPFTQQKHKCNLVESFEKYKSYFSILEMCQLAGIKILTFYRYRIDVLGCKRVGFK
jgi:hypothetical protein